MSNYLEEAMAKINGMERPDTERVKRLEVQVCELQEALKALLDKMAAPMP